MDTAQLWARCRAGDASSRACLIERYLPLAQALSRRVRTVVTAIADSDANALAAQIENQGNQQYQTKNEIGYLVNRHTKKIICKHTV